MSHPWAACIRFQTLRHPVALLCLLLALLAGAGFRPSAAATGSIPLSVRNIGTAPEVEAPVFTGIPFPPGALWEVDRINLVHNGVPVPRQVQRLSTYPDGSLRVVLVGFRVNLAPGQELLASIEYGGSAGVALAPMPWTRNLNVLALCAPRWYGRSSVFNLPFAASGDNALLPAFETRLLARYGVTSDPAQDADPDVRNYYDHAHALYMTLLRTGGPASAVRRIWEEVSQYRENEILHSGPFQGQYAAGSQAGTNAYPMPFAVVRRMYVLGLLEDYYFTGDPRSLEVAREMGEALLRDVLLQNERYAWTERVPGLALSGLTSLYEATLDDRYLAAARRIGTLVMDHQDVMAVKYPDQGGVKGQTGGYLQDRNGMWYDGAESEAPGCGSPWMTTLLGEGLIKAYWLTGNSRIRDSLVRAADWLVDAAFVPADHPLNGDGSDTFWYIAVDPGNPDTTLPLNPMFLQMLGFAHQVTGDGKYLNIARRILAPNYWGRTLKEYNQGMRTCGQGLYLLQHAPGTLPLTLNPAGEVWDKTPPAPPTGVSSTPGDRQVNLSWSPNPEPDVAGYLVYYGYESQRVSLRLAETPIPQPRFTVTGLDNGTTYFFSVVAVDRSGNQSEPSGPVSCLPYAGNTATYSISGTITASGAGLPGVTVRAGAAQGMTSSTGAYTLSGLATGSYQVTAEKSGYTLSPAQTVAVGPNRNGIDFTATPAGDGGLASPDGLEAVPGDRKTDLYWSPVRGASGYRIYWAYEESGVYRDAGLTSIPEFQHTGLDNGVTYWYRVAAVSGSGEGPRSSAVSARISSGWFEISGKVSIAGQPCAGAVVTAGRRTYTTKADGVYRLGGLDQGTYSVAATQRGAAFNSRTVRVGPSQGGVDFDSTTEEVELAAPTGLKAVGGDRQVALTWNPVSNATGYHVFRSYSRDETGESVSLVTGTSFTDTDLENQVTCWYQVSAVAGPEESPGSGAVSATPHEAKYEVCGYVRSGSGGIGGAVVRVGKRSATTNARGFYRVRGLRSGQQTVRARKPGYSFTPKTVIVGPSQSVDLTGLTIGRKYSR